MVGSTVRTPDGLGTVLEVNPVSGYLRVRCGTESLAPGTTRWACASM